MWQLNRKDTEIGINVLHNYYDFPIIPKESTFSHYLFQGQHVFSSSLFYKILWKNCLLFGEFGLNFRPRSRKVPYTSSGFHPALLAGLVVGLLRYVDVSIVAYYYGKGFYSRYGNAFKRYVTEVANEKGIYGAVKYTPCNKWKLTAALHTFANLRPKPHLAGIANGYRLKISSGYFFSKATIGEMAYTLGHSPKRNIIPSSKQSGKHKVEATHHMEKAASICIAKKHAFKITLRNKFTHSWWSNIEVHYALHHFTENKHGYAVGTMQVEKNKFHLTCKVVYFNASTYASSLYFYIPTPLYNGTQFRAYYGHGTAMALLLCWKPNRAVRAEISYRTNYIFNSCFNKVTASVKHPSYRAGTDQQKATIQLLIRL